MSTIDTHTNVMTLVNVFTVQPENQNRLVDLLTEATEHTMKGLPGFVSANIHRSLDGRRVVNYAQWRSQADFEALKENPDARVHMKAAAKLATFEPIVCEVVDSVTNGQPG